MIYKQSLSPSEVGITAGLPSFWQWNRDSVWDLEGEVAEPLSKSLQVDMWKAREKHEGSGNAQGLVLIEPFSPDILI